MPPHLNCYDLNRRHTRFRVDIQKVTVLCAHAVRHRKCRLQHASSFSIPHFQMILFDHMICHALLSKGILIINKLQKENSWMLDNMERLFAKRIYKKFYLSIYLGNDTGIFLSIRISFQPSVYDLVTSAVYGANIIPVTLEKIFSRRYSRWS